MTSTSNIGVLSQGTITKSPSLEAGATFSICERYRYLLWRQWSVGPTVVFCLLNPSTANELVLDPTLRRCLGFAKAFGFGRFEIVNLFALRSTDPRALSSHRADPVGPANDLIIKERFALGNTIIVGWGAYPLAPSRVSRLIALAEGKPLHCLGVTKAGAPRHPLYLSARSELKVWTP